MDQIHSNDLYFMARILWRKSKNPDSRVVCCSHGGLNSALNPSHRSALHGALRETEITSRTLLFVCSLSVLQLNCPQDVQIMQLTTCPCSTALEISPKPRAMGNGEQTHPCTSAESGLLWCIQSYRALLDGSWCTTLHLACLCHGLWHVQ